MFGSKKYVTKEQQEKLNKTLWGKYMQRMRKNSLIYFGLPFFAMMLLGTHFMTQFASIRYEQHDRRLQEVSQDDALKLSGKKRKVDLKDEYYRLQHMDLDSWEQKRVQRLPGESDNKW